MVDREACIKSCFMTITTEGETNLRLPGLSKNQLFRQENKNPVCCEDGARVVIVVLPHNV